MSAGPIVACRECDLLQRVPPLPTGGKARCPRCGFTLAARPTDPIDRPLALTITAAIVLVVANSAPLMDLSAVGRHASTTIAGGVYEMWVRGEPVTAAIVAFCAVVAPACFVLFMLAVLLAARRPPAPHWAGELLRWGLHMQPWSMFEVMLLGILVALIKIAELATVEPGIGLYAIGALVVLIPAITVTFDPREVWRRVESWDDAPASGGARAEATR
jgi:paraquat-inducible protein A